MGRLAPTAILILLLGAAPARAVDYTVTRTDDPAPGACDADCSLREAVIAANATPANDVVILPPNTHGLTIPGDDAGSLTGDLDIQNNGTLTIRSQTPGATRSTIIDGNDLDRVIDVHTGANLTLEHVTVTDGKALTVSNNAFGGGIRNNTATLTLTEGAVIGNQSFGTPNQGTGHGGGIANVGGTVTAVRSLIAGNEADQGGGIFTTSTTNITNSTISGNDAGELGGGLYPNGPGTTLLGATVARNTAGVANGGGGIFAGSAPSLRLTLLAGNTADGASNNCNSSGIVSNGDNLFDDASCGMGAPGDKTGLDAQLSDLADNGGATDTHAIAATSPARDAVIDCGGLPHDQRQVLRPQGPSCDIGAFELAPAPAGGPGAAGVAGAGAADGGAGPPPPCCAPVRDSRAPDLSLGAASRQSVGRRDGVVVTGTADEDGTLTAAGTVNVPGASKVLRFRDAGARVQAGRKFRVLLKLSRKNLRSVNAALRRGRKLVARVTVTVRDAAGNKRSARRSVGLVR